MKKFHVRKKTQNKHWEGPQISCTKNLESAAEKRQPGIARPPQTRSHSPGQCLPPVNTLRVFSALFLPLQIPKDPLLRTNPSFPKLTSRFSIGNALRAPIEFLNEIP